MFRILGFVPVKQGWSRQQWLDHYAGHHGPLLASVPSFQQHCRRYAQNYILTGQGQANAGYAGASELWFETREAVSAAFADPDYLRIVRPDELFFNDLAGVRQAIVEETTVSSRSQAEPRYKIFAKLPHGAALQDDPDLTATAYRHLQLKIVRDVDIPASIPDHIDELWFNSGDDARRAWSHLRDTCSISDDFDLDGTSTFCVAAQHRTIFADQSQNQTNEGEIL